MARKTKRKFSGQNYDRQDDNVKLVDRWNNLLYSNLLRSDVAKMGHDVVERIGKFTYRMLPPVEPSKSRDTACQLNKFDVTVLAGMHFPDCLEKMVDGRANEFKPTMIEIERLMGYGVIGEAA